MSNANVLDPIRAHATDNERRQQYARVMNRLEPLLRDETDRVAFMATVVCELHHAFDYYNWTGFYRNLGGELVIGPYQGTHGCLRIAFGRGVCGAAARTKTTQLVDDVHNFPGHIACSSSTQSEVVVPWTSQTGDLLGVLDVDSDSLAAFTRADVIALEEILHHLGSSRT